MFHTNIVYPLRYMDVKTGKRLGISEYPNWGPNPNVTGLRKLYNLNKEYLVKCGSYVYRVNSSIYYKAKER